MPSIQPPAISRERRRHVMRLIKRSGILTADVSDDARVTYVLGALVCDDTGYLKKDDLTRAAQNPRLLALAENMLAMAGLESVGLS